MPVVLQEHSPAVAELPTTNGDWAQGEGIQLGAGLGASLLHMEQVQVHPTGFVDPADPTAGTKVSKTGGIEGHLDMLLLRMEQVQVHPAGEWHRL